MLGYANEIAQRQATRDELHRSVRVRTEGAPPPPEEASIARRRRACCSTDAANEGLLEKASASSRSVACVGTTPRFIISCKFPGDFSSSTLCVGC